MKAPSHAVPAILTVLALLAGCTSPMDSSPAGTSTSDPADGGHPGLDAADVSDNPDAADLVDVAAATLAGLELSGCQVADYMRVLPRPAEPSWLPPGYGQRPWSTSERSLLVLVATCASAVLDGTQQIEDARLAVVLMRVDAPQPTLYEMGDHLVLEAYASPPGLVAHLRSHGVPAQEATIEVTLAESLGKAVVTAPDGPRFSITQSIHDEAGPHVSSLERWHAWDGTPGSEAWLDVSWGFEQGDWSPMPAVLHAEGGRLALLMGAAPLAHEGMAMMFRSGAVWIESGAPPEPAAA